MMNMDGVLAYISLQNVSCIHFYYTCKWKGVDVKYLLFNVLQSHKKSRPIFYSASHWKPNNMLEAITRLSKLTHRAIAIILQVLADTPGSITLWRGLQLFFSQWNGESGGELKASEGVASCKKCKPSWDTLVSLSGSYVKSEDTCFLQLIKQLQE